MLISSLVSVCLMLAPMLRTVDAPADSKVYQIEFSLYQAEMLQSNIKKVTKVLSNPTLTVLSGKPGRFMVGGEHPVPFTKPVEFEPTGVIISMTLSTVDQKHCLVKLNAEDRTMQVQTNELLVQASNQIRLHGKVELNKPMSLRLTGGVEGKQTWVDFTVSEVRR